MTGHEAFVTFGLPAIAIAGALIGLYVTSRNANRLRERLPQPQIKVGKLKRADL